MSLKYERDARTRPCGYNGSNVQAFNAHRLLYHSTLGVRVRKKKEEERPSKKGTEGAIGRESRDFSDPPNRHLRDVLLRAVPIDTVLNLRKTDPQKCEAVPRRARIQGS